MGRCLAHAQNENKDAGSDSFQHSVGINIRPSYTMPTHGFYNGWNPIGKPLRAGGSAHLDYSFSYPASSLNGRMYPGAYQGIGLGVQSLSSHKYIGTPVLVYLFQGAPLARIDERLTFGYEWNFGLSAGWKVNEYLLTASSINLYVNVGLLFTWNINPRWNLVFGPEYTHYSNGDTKFPNAGANTVNFRMGVRRIFNRESPAAEELTIFNIKQDFEQDVTYDLTAFGAWRADRTSVNGKLHITNNPFLVAGLQFNPLYHFNHYFSSGLALDLLYDRSANLQASLDEEGVLSYHNPGFLNQCAAGLSLRGELKMPIFAVNIGIGYNLCNKGSELSGIYGLFALKAFITDSLFLNAGYRLGKTMYAHNLMLGIGWRFSPLKD